MHSLPLCVLVAVILPLSIGRTTRQAIRTVRIKSYEKTRVEPSSFPLCCEEEVFDLRSSLTHRMLVWFVDLDLPMGSNLTFYEKYYNGASMQHLHTVEWDGRGWWKPDPFISRKSVVRVIFQPGPDDGIEHAGFVLMAEAEEERQWLTSFYGRPITTYCVHVIDVLKGGRVPMAGLDLGPHLVTMAAGTTFSCTWQLRIPSQLQERGMHAYVQFQNAHFDGSLQVFSGISSGAPNLYDESGEQSLEPLLSHMFDSPDGLFISLSKMEIQDVSNVIDFTYGLYKPMEKGEVECYLGDTAEYVCKKSRWCIPFVNVCNNVSNCPHAEDEHGCSVQDMKTTDKDSVLPRGRHYPTDSCLATGGQQCDYGNVCYMEREKCNDALDCADATDEIDCHDYKKKYDLDFDLNIDVDNKKVHCYGRYCQSTGPLTYIVTGVILGVAAISILGYVTVYLCKRQYRHQQSRGI